MFGAPYPDSTVMFDEIDHRAGWYAGADWSDADDWRLQLFRYDNEADPAAHRNDYFAWRTDFWDVGFSKTWQDFTLLAQGLTGETIITPFPGFTSITEFDSAYGLLGWERDDWRVAARGDWFRTHTGGNAFFSEDGYALTFAATWVPKDWLRLTGEILYVDSSRDERTIEGLAPNQSDTQGQLSVRFYL
jgi:hypothetical protein